MNVVNALAFLVDVSFGFFVLLLLLRFLVNLLRMGWYEPPARFAYVLTQPVLIWLYRLGIPAWRNVDFSVLLLLLVVQMVKIILVVWLYGQSIGLLGLTFLAVHSLIVLTLYVFVFAIFIYVLLSWVAVTAYGENPLQDFLYKFTLPILRPVRRVVKPIEGFDLAPFVATVGLLLLITLLQ